VTLFAIYRLWPAPQAPSREIGFHPPKFRPAETACSFEWMDKRASARELMAVKKMNDGIRNARFQPVKTCSIVL